MGRLNDIIEKYADSSPVRFHMPGHKGRFSDALNYSRDVTELFFTDNLYEPDPGTNLIFELEDRISNCFFPGKDKKINSLISCSGATLCIHSAILSLHTAKKDAKYIICDRASHISFMNIISLLKITPLWIYPDEDFAGKTGDFANDKKSEEIIGVFVTSPDYFGGMKNIKNISEKCKKYSLDLIVDNSHGAHLAFYEKGKLHPINLGADISVDSIHKTLPALTGAALLHAKADLCEKSLLKDSMKVFASTSPSYLILQSIEKAVDWLEIHGEKQHSDLILEIDLFRQRAAGLGFVFENGKSRDPYRIVLGCENAGEKLYYFLARKNIVCEFYTKDRVILIPSISNCPEDFGRLFGELQIFAKKNKIIPVNPDIYTYPPGTIKNLGKDEVGLCSL